MYLNRNQVENTRQILEEIWILQLDLSTDDYSLATETRLGYGFFLAYHVIMCLQKTFLSRQRFIS